MTTIRIEGFYDVPADVLWRHVVRYDALEAAMSGRLVRVKCPPGEVPVGRWRFKVVARDDIGRRLRSTESGTGVRRWTHEIGIEEAGNDGSRLSDTIEIDAGVLTPIIVRFARSEYERRHRLRRQMIERESASG